MSSRQALVRGGLGAFYLAALSLPVYVFFTDRGGTAILDKLSISGLLQVLFPLIGMYAFTLVTLQVLIATNLRWLQRAWPNVINFHRFQGLFALLFATLHPLFILAGFGLAAYLEHRFVTMDLKWWILPAYAALIIMWLTVTTAVLAWKGVNLPWWRKLHRLNYLVFALVWIHSWFIGTDTQLPLLRKVWIIYLLLVVASVVGKYYPVLSFVNHHNQNSRST